MAQDMMNLSGTLERVRLSGRLSIFSGITAFALALTVLLTGPVYQWSGLAVFSLGLIPFTVAFLLALTSWIRSLLSGKMLEEEEEKVLLEKRKENLQSILAVSEDVRFTAQRTFQNFNRYFPSFIALLSFLLTLGSVILIWRGMLFANDATQILTSGLPKNPIHLAFLAGMSAALSFFVGIFLTGQSQIREFRYLRPVGSWLIVGALTMAFAGIAALLVAYDGDSAKVSSLGWAELGGKIIACLLSVLSVEFLLNFIMEFYRPRTQQEGRPVFESRILALVLEPGGLVRNIAESLDYQFGFKVSKTGVYRIFEKAVIPALIVWGGVLWLSTGISQVDPGQLGIRERFGALAQDHQVLHPGIHFKLPWPFERIVRVPVDVVQTVAVGAKLKADLAGNEKNVILWTGNHYAQEDGFLVAIEKTSREQMYAVSILDASLPVSYRPRASEVYEYAFNYQNLSDTLNMIGESEATTYFASTDFMRDISSGREQVSEELKKRIQKAADQLKLGIEIVCVNLHDAHPPVGSGDGGINVAEAFQQVFGAQEEAAAEEYKAFATKSKIETDARIEHIRIVANAQAYQFNVSHVAQADAFRFGKQLSAFRQMPAMFRLRTYLDFLENDCRELRKYVVSAKIPSQIYELNMEEKPRLDLIDADVSQLGKE